MPPARFPLITSATRSNDVIFYMMNNYTGALISPPYHAVVVAQNATTQSFIAQLQVPSGSFGNTPGNLIAEEGSTGFYYFDGEKIYHYQLIGSTITQISNTQLCSTTNSGYGTHHIQSPAHFLNANLTIDNIISGVCNFDNVVWAYNGNIDALMTNVHVTGNCQFLLDGYINLGLLANQYIVTLCITGPNFFDQVGQEQYTVSSYSTNGPTVLNGGHIVATNILNTTLFSTGSFSKVQNMDYSGFTFLDVSNNVLAKPVTMQDVCNTGDCPKVSNVWQNFESGSSSGFFKNGIIVNYDKALKGVRIYNNANFTQMGSRTCGTDCFPVSINTVPWLSLSGENPNLVYEGTYNSITLWNTTTETGPIYNNTQPTLPGQNGTGNQCQNAPSFTFRQSYDVTPVGGASTNSLGTEANVIGSELFKPSSRYLGLNIHAITYHIFVANEATTPNPALLQLGVFNPDGSAKRIFATVDVHNSTQFSTGENIFNVTLPTNNPYTIVGNDRVGEKALFNDSFSNNIQDANDNVGDFTDGHDSLYSFFSSSDNLFHEFGDGADWYGTIYTQTQNPCNAPAPGGGTTPPSAFCQNPANANILQCRLASENNTLNVGPGIQNLIQSTGIFNLCSGTFKTNGFGYLITLLLVVITVGLLWVALKGRMRDMPTFLWVMVAIGIFGFSTAIGCIDPTILIITIIAIIALGVASTTEVLQGSLRRIVARGEG